MALHHGLLCACPQVESPKDYAAKVFTLMNIALGRVRTWPFLRSWMQEGAPSSHARWLLSRGRLGCYFSGKITLYKQL